MACRPATLAAVKGEKGNSTLKGSRSIDSGHVLPLGAGLCVLDPRAYWPSNLLIRSPRLCPLLVVFVEVTT